jgi:hypothetical protein
VRARECPHDGQGRALVAVDAADDEDARPRRGHVEHLDRPALDGVTDDESRR